MTDVVHRLAASPWIPFVISTDDGLGLQVAVDLDRGYDIREFLFPVTERHLDVLRAELARHLLLWCALEPLCEAAGRKGRDVQPDSSVARATIDVVLLGAEAEVVDHLSDLPPMAVRRLAAHHADPEALEHGDLFTALASVSAEADWDLVHERDAQRSRAQRGIVLTPLDEAVLRYTGLYLHPSAAPRRLPDAVDPTHLPEVLELVAQAEAAAAGVEEHALRDVVTATLAHRNLSVDATEAVGSLLWFEARRAR